MKLNKDKQFSKFKINSYNPGTLTINNKNYTNNVILTQNKIIENWNINNINNLSIENLDYFLEFQPEIILIGTGEQNIIINPKLTSYVNNKRVGLEIMNTLSACRIYNILANENRKLVAGLVL